MRKKFLIGVLMVTSVSVLVGGHFFARTNAQDPAKKAEPEKKSEGDLFEAIKQSLEGKKEAPTLPTPVVQPPMIAPPPLPPIAPAGLSAPPTVKDEKPALPLPGPIAAPQLAVQTPAPPLNSAYPPPAQSTPSVAPVAEPPTPMPSLTPLPVSNPPQVVITQPSPVQAPPTVQITPHKIADDLAKIKDSPWTLHVGTINGQTVVTAIVHQKHEFKIICQSLDLQTGKGTLKATGKVQITGDMMAGSCDQLGISLLEDRLLLEGNALVSIQKLSTNVSSERPASFELKGATLDLRISELQSKFRQTSLSVEREPGSLSPRSAAMMRGTNSDAKQWSPYGRLVRTQDSLPGKEMLWRLEGNDGKTIALLVARDGGTLVQFEGQNISVLGTSEQSNGRPVLRVTHIALP